MSLASCTTKHGSKLDMAELRAMAEVYQNDPDVPMDAEAAMIQAVRDKIDLLNAERAQVIQIVKDKAIAAGVFKGPVALEPTPAPAPAARPAGKPLSEMSLDELEQERGAVENELEFAEPIDATRLKSRLSRIENAMLVKEMAEASQAGTRMTDKEADAEAAAGDEEYVEPARFGKGETGTFADDVTPEPYERTAGRDSPDLLALLRTKPSLKRVLRDIRNYGSAMYGPLTHEIATLMGFDGIRIEFSDTEKINAAGKRVGGEYDPRTNTVTIYRGGANEHIIMHEVVHAITSHRIEQARALVEEARTNAKRRFTEQEEHLMDAYTRLADLRIEAAAEAGRRKIDTTQIYGLKLGPDGVAEFVAEAMTNPDFQDYLRSVRSEQKPLAPSLWKQFVQFMKSLLNLKGPELESVLARVLETVPEVVATRQEADRISTRVLEHTANNVVGAFVPSPRAATSTLAEFARKHWFKDKMVKGGFSLKAGLQSVQTSRGRSQEHPWFAKIVDMASAMAQRKQEVMTDFDEAIAPYVASQRPTNYFTGEISEEGKLANDMLAATGNFFSEGMPGDLLKEMTKLARSYFDNTSALYTIDAISGNPKLAKAIEDRVLLSKRQFEEGVFITNDQRTVKFPDNFTSEQKDAAYNAYRSAMMSMADAHLQKLVSAEIQATEMEKGDERALTKFYKGDTYESMKRMRALYAGMYKRMSQLDLSKPKTEQMDPMFVDKLDRIGKNLHGLVRGEVIPQSAEFKMIAEAFDVAPAELEKIVEPLIASTKATGAAKNSHAATMQNDIIGAAQPARVKEAKVYTAVKELLGMYIPFRRDGEWTMALKLIDKDGNDLIGSIRLPDGTVKQSGSILDVWQGDSLTAMEEAHEEMMAELVAVGNEIEVDVAVLDGEGRRQFDETGNLVSRKQKATLAWTRPEQTNSGRSVAMKISPMQMLTTLETIGIQVTPSMRERIIVGTTNQEASIRGRLQREFTRGYSTDYNKVMADYLGSVASSVAINEYSHRLQEMTSKLNDGWNWTTDREKALLAKEAEVEAATDPMRKAFLQKELNGMSADRRRIQTARPIMASIKQEAVDFVEYVLGQNELEERNSLVNKTRGAVTIIQLGATLASALTNLSSLPLNTFSFLTTYSSDRDYGGGFGASKASDALIRAGRALGGVLKNTAEPIWNWTNKSAFVAEHYYREKIDRAVKLGDENALVDGYKLAHWEFMRKAAADGILGAQKYNELLSLRKRSQFGPRMSKAISHYMALFTATEEYNRSVTALASFELFYQEALDGGMDKDAAFDRAYDKTVQAVYATQGEYNQINRPKLFRSDVGALVFLYKTYVVTTLELLANLPPKGRAMFLGTLYTMSGAGGLPMWEELMVVMDFTAQKTGLGLGITKGNAERAFAEFANDVGEMVGIEKMDHIMLRGLMDTYFTGGIDVGSRAGLQVGVPGLGMLRAGADFYEELGRTTGAIGGAVEGTSKALGKLAKGDIEGATRAVPITLIKNISESIAYAKYGAVMNKRGQVVLQNPTALDIAARSLGFYPAEFKWANDLVRREEYTRAFAKELKNGFTEQYREAAVLNDAAAKREVVDMVREHNENFRGTALEIMDFQTSAERAGKEAKLSLRERAQKTLPKPQQRDSQLPE